MKYCFVDNITHNCSTKSLKKFLPLGTIADRVSCYILMKILFVVISAVKYIS